VIRAELAIGCADPNGLARFWCSVWGPPWPIAARFDIQEGAGGKTVKNRLHLDVNPTGKEQDEEVRRLLDLGVRRTGVGQTGDESWVVLAGLEGNEFCVLADRCPDRRAGTSPALLPVACPSSREHDEEPLPEGESRLSKVKLCQLHD
jgi:hypothetical protein